uniref:retinoblastoma-like protein 2 n=1 Tax=Semicossyphus pulcher TaxID=241346 RepID=UPI0037E8D63B
MANEPDINPEFGPSDRLTAIFRSCSRDPTEAIRSRLSGMLNMFLQHHRSHAGNEGTNELADRCCYQAGKLFYRLLEKLAIHERERLGTSDISSQLNNEHCHNSLVVCCLEITTSSNNLPYDFPLLLQILKLAPYHFGNVIELVLRAEDRLPLSVTTHLAQLEKKVLESLAWTSDSPLWEILRAIGGSLPTCQQVMPPQKLEDPSTTQLEGSLPGVSANPVEQPSTSAENQPQRSNSLTLFTRKVYMLTSERLRELCSKLDISDELRLKIWTVFEHSLVHFTDLMVDRHLDQLLMCGIYITAKNGDITFNQIMERYQSLPFACKSVCQNVLISGKTKENSLTGNNSKDVPSSCFLTPDTPSAHYPARCQEERGTLKNFYNKVYWTKMKDFAMKFAAPAGVNTPVSPAPRRYTPSTRRYQLSNRISISTHNTGTPPQQTPGLSYRFNSDDSERLREINNMVSGRTPRNRRSHVALPMDREEEEEGEDGPPARRPRLDGPSALQRRLMNVLNDRQIRL